ARAGGRRRECAGPRPGERRLRPRCDLPVKQAVRESRDWPEANQRHLMSALKRIGDSLDRHPASADGTADETTDQAPSMSPPSAVEQVRRTFGLSTFERDVLLLCAGIELDS